MRNAPLLAATTVFLLSLPAAAAESNAETGRFDDRAVVGVRHSFYDGTSNDLLTGGLGKSGLQVAPPAYVDPLHPTSAELRTRAIYNNYRALVDISPNGGYGVLYGPNIDLSGADTLGQGKIAGDEYFAYADDGSGRQNVTMMVQIPSSFDPANACIVTAVSSGSRGVYGAIATAGEWGLKRGCTVAYSDKGTGNGTHDLQADTVNLIDGLRQDAVAAGTQSNFTADLSASELAAFDSATPNRFAFKHAHSQQNPERSWGRHTLLAVKFAFHVLNQQFAGHGHRRFTRANTLVIASSASNGAGAAIAAAEQDEDGLIDGVAVSEPQIQPRRVEGLLIQRGTNAPFAGGGKALYDYFTFANLFQPCAAQSTALTASPFLASINATRGANRCASLKAKGLLSSSSTGAQADEALAMLHNAGWEAESDLLHASHYGTSAVPGVTLTYANAYGQFSVADNLCGYSFGATTATTSIVCRFPADKELECQAGEADSARGNASNPAGLQGHNHRFRVFAGLRDDPFFNNVRGTRAAYEKAALALRDGAAPDRDSRSSRPDPDPRFARWTVAIREERWP